jgi:Lar family restriction alleviation protein
MEKLKNCPFCGSKAETKLSIGRRCVYIKCNGCGAKTKDYYFTPGGDGELNGGFEYLESIKDDAVTDWNRREGQEERENLIITGITEGIAGLWQKVREMGGTDAKKGSYDDGWDEAFAAVDELFMESFGATGYLNAEPNENKDEEKRGE